MIKKIIKLTLLSFLGISFITISNVSADVNDQINKDNVSTEVKDQSNRDNVATDTKDQINKDNVSTEVKDQRNKDNVATDTKDQSNKDNVATDTKDQNNKDTTPTLSSDVSYPSISQYEDNISTTIKIDHNQLLEKLDNKDDFVLFVGYANCKYCRLQSTELRRFMDKDNVSVYYLNWQNVKNDPSIKNNQEFMNFIDKDLQMDGTPTISLINKGKVNQDYTYSGSGFSVSDFELMLPHLNSKDNVPVDNNAQSSKDNVPTDNKDQGNKDNVPADNNAQGSKDNVPTDNKDQGNKDNVPADNKGNSILGGLFKVIKEVVYNIFNYLYRFFR